MPELPEVETIRRQLERLIVGRTISSIEVFNPGSFRADQDSLIGRTITVVGRKGKVLIVGPDNLYIHLKMSGQLEFIDKTISNISKKARPFPKRPGLPRAKHLRVVITFIDGSCLLFHDQRKFGWITDDPAVLPKGIDALDSKLTVKKLEEILQSSNRPIKTILLDQSKIAGIGNIYASEILWEAKINPANPASKGLAFRAQGETLIKAIREILYEAIRFGGSTMGDGLYQHVGGESGSYWSRRRVYDRGGQPCRRPACRKIGAVIRKTAIAHRSTYWCPNCQAG
ncbi:bifunctional DNA-formamidopyrimidine glycosylase/DNA-(apurinic or apyrimidinic site) lyase [Candidatus Collierbacteria bacterium]|nr:bifunctional DNA-formamidopyrimidine glycosylase/DNA-(apurinic or apyrimidinic site) lyase [Candidatus Collierbacteria bacterium]